MQVTQQRGRELVSDAPILVPVPRASITVLKFIISVITGPPDDILDGRRGIIMPPNGPTRTEILQRQEQVKDGKTAIRNSFHSLLARHLKRAYIYWGTLQTCKDTQQRDHKGIFIYSRKLGKRYPGLAET